jgi:hypothetical protein
MTKAGRALLVAVTVPYLSGCFGVLPTPIPASPSEREALNVQGVVIGSRPDDGEGDAEGERIEFADIQNVTWSADAVSIVGVPRNDDGAQQLAERRFPLSSLSAVLVRQLDPGRTSAIIGGVVVGTAAIIGLLVTGQGASYD